jgi:hypothetical protein
MGTYPKATASRQGASQNVAVTTVSAASTAFGSQTYQVLLVATAAMNVRIDHAPTATATDTLLPANVPLIFQVTPGEQVAAITGSGTGTLSVTELS